MKPCRKNLTPTKLTLALFALSASSIIHAAMYVPPAVTPVERNAWLIAVEGLYVQPSSGTDVTYAYGVANSSDFRRAIENTLNFKPKWNYGFRLEGAYQFSKGRDISVNWTHFNNSVDEFHRKEELARNGFSGAFLSPYLPFFTFESALIGYDSIRATNKIKFDAVNVELGKRDIKSALLGDKGQVRYFVGVQYANIRNDAHILGSFVRTRQTPVGTAVLVGEGESHVNMQFQGIGPRLGTNFDVGIGSGFSIVGRGAVAVLIGQSKNDMRTRAFMQLTVPTIAPETFINVVTTKSAPTNTVVIPALEGKLGAKYAYGNSAGVFSIEGGWQAASYINALTTIPLTSSVPGSTNTPPTALTYVKNSFNYQGPYLGVSWLANA